LKRVADPDSRFHGHYLSYQHGRIDRDQLLSRLPHIAMIGDSLSTGLYVSSRLSTFWRARTRFGNNWFLDTDPSPKSVYSVFERLDRVTPVIAIEYARMGALVDSQSERLPLSRRILGTRNFSGQVEQLLSQKRFPDLILIWIGHNNVDWAWRAPAAELKEPEARLQRLSNQFRQNYTGQMQRLIERARIESHRVAIAVFGLADFRSFFKARRTAEIIREKDKSLYPYLGSDCKYLISMRPLYRDDLIRLVGIVNDGLRAMVGQLSRDLKLADCASVQVQYCAALAEVDLSSVEVIHAVDGWHPSVHGHNLFAEAAYRDLEPCFKFLGLVESAV
jgi:lysophospholipase L1-like esterase